MLFTKPAANPANYAPGVNAIELPAGKIVEFLLGFENKADEGRSNKKIIMFILLKKACCPKMSVTCTGWL